MAGKLEGQIAVVTGGSTGIALAVAKRFAKEGAGVFVTGRRKAELAAAVGAIGPGTTGVRADSADLSDLDRLYERVKTEAGRIDVLFVNAGGGSMLSLGSITEEQIRRHVRPQCEGRALHGAEGAAASGRRRLGDPHRFQRQHQGHAGVQRL
jgi:NAD(P)-dependent dehydrogenase (short-subunit alcohol dehydrogenase family)